MFVRCLLVHNRIEVWYSLIVEIPWEKERRRKNLSRSHLHSQRNWKIRYCQIYWRRSDGLTGEEKKKWWEKKNNKNKKKKEKYCSLHFNYWNICRHSVSRVSHSPSFSSPSHHHHQHQHHNHHHHHHQCRFVSFVNSHKMVNKKNPKTETRRQNGKFKCHASIHPFIRL